MPWWSQLNQRKRKRERGVGLGGGTKLMICSKDTPDQIPDGAALLLWANIHAHIQVSLEALVLTITTVPERERASLWAPDE